MKGRDPILTIYKNVFKSDWPIWVKRKNIYINYNSESAHTFKIMPDGNKIVYFGQLNWSEAIRLENI